MDLTHLTRGFTNNGPVYTILSSTNGDATVLGGTTAHFVPNVATDSLGSFSFSVTDANGYSMTNEVGIHILTSVAPPQGPLLGLRNEGGNFILELTDESGRKNMIQTSEDLSSWSDWTNVTATGTTQSIPVSGLTNENRLFLRAIAQ